MELIFATHNEHKVIEINHLLGTRFKLSTLDNAGIQENIPEDQETLQGNALQKAWYIYNKTGMNCFADDTGLEVEALNNEPGVFSARYAGNDKDDDKNIKLLLKNLSGIKDRIARFRTVIALIIKGEEWLFEGKVEGHILKEKRGNEGFGYDPVFMPEGYNQSFAEMKLSEKNKISHRARAFEKLGSHLKKLSEDNS